MLKSMFPGVLCLLVLCSGLTYGKAHKRVSRKSSPAGSASRVHKSSKARARLKTGARKTTSAAVSGNRAKKAVSQSRTSNHNVRAAARRSSQQVPTPERYREIQQALADKGYLKGELTGSWGPDSTDALRRFQKDQNLSDSGKLDSLSLIALGLGPKRNLSARSTSESRPKDDNRRPEGSERP